MAICCIANVSQEKEIENPLLSQFRDSINVYLKNPSCDNTGLLISRSLDGTVHPSLAEDARKDLASYTDTSMAGPFDDERKVEGLLLTILTAAASKAMLDAEILLWDTTIGLRFGNLKIDSLKRYLGSLPAWKIEGPIQMVHRILCSPHLWNNKARRGNGSGRTQSVGCTTMGCKVNSDWTCNDEAPDTGPIRRRRRAQEVGDKSSSSAMSISTQLSVVGRDASLNSSNVNYVSLAKRALQIARDYQTTMTDVHGDSYSTTITLPDVSAATGLPRGEHGSWLTMESKSTLLQEHLTRTTFYMTRPLIS
jgi:hypothetical protein